MLILIIIIIVTIMIITVKNKNNSFKDVIVEQEVSQEKSVNDDYQQNIIEVANEAVNIIEQGAKLYFDCVARHPEKDSFNAGIINIKKENNSMYSVTVMCAYPELASACKDLNIFSEFPHWCPAFLYGTTDYMSIKRIGSLKIDSSSWSIFEQKTKELISQKHPEWIYTGQKMSKGTIVYE